MIFKRAVRVWGLTHNPVASLERPRLPKRAGIDVYSREEVMQLVRTAESEQDAAIFLTAAFTGLRQGELLGLRWGAVDFGADLIRVTQSYTHGRVDTPKSGHGRAVPMMFDVAEVLARLGQREHFTSDSDLVFCGPEGGHVDPTRLLKRYKAAQVAAGLRPLRFHDLRHTFGTHAIRIADPRELMEWMGHADITTTQIYLSYKPRADAARRLGDAFEEPGQRKSRSSRS